ASFRRTPPPVRVSCTRGAGFPSSGPGVRLATLLLPVPLGDRESKENPRWIACQRPRPSAPVPPHHQRARPVPGRLSSRRSPPPAPSPCPRRPHPPPPPRTVRRPLHTPPCSASSR